MTGTQAPGARAGAPDLLKRKAGEPQRPQAANELKDEFLAVMSHELKHPLNLIQVNAELLTRLPEAAEHPSGRGRSATTIRRAVEQPGQIIDDLLDLSRIRTGKLRLQPGRRSM